MIKVSIVQNKKVVILVVLVLGIWGTIAARIIMGLTEEEVVDMPILRNLSKDTVQTVSYDLALSYDDPFLKRDRKVSVTSPSAAVVRHKIKMQTPAPPAPEIVIPWNLIQYSGLIYNSTRKSKTAAIILADKEYFLREGEELENFKVLEILSDSIKVGYSTSKQFKYIKKK